MYQMAMNAQNTIVDAKRLIGRKFSDSTVQADMKHWPFKVVKGANDTPVIEVMYKGEMKQFKAEEVSAMVLTKMKGIAEAYLGKEVKNAVITVPAYFNDSQRQSTKDAGNIAGLNVVRIISEPTAAALAYGLHQQETEKNILVFDLGGGTFDVSVMNVKNGEFRVKAVGGDTHLGGEDFDNRMVEYFVDEFQRKHQKNISDSRGSLCRLRTACERAKRALSSSTQATIDIDSLFENIDFYSSITRALFDDLCQDYFAKCMTICKEVLLESRLDADAIDDIVLVGGSTRIQKIRSMLSDVFKGKVLSQSINADEAVAYGATVQAAMLSKVGVKPNILLYDVTPLSLGINIEGDLMSTVIARNTTIPAKKTQRYKTTYDNQTSMCIMVLEGERSMTKDNHLLGKFSLHGIPPLPRGKVRAGVTFAIDDNGILTVSALEKSTGKEEKIVITNDMGRLSNDEIERMISEAERYKIEDEANKNRAEAKVLLKNYCFKLQSMLKSTEVKSDISAKEITDIESAIYITLMFIEAYPSAEVQIYKDKQIELEKRAQRMLATNHGQKENVKNAGGISPGAVAMELLKIAADLAMRAVLDATLKIKKTQLFQVVDVIT